MTFSEYESAVSQLNIWTNLYDAGTPIVSDKEWDNLYFNIAEFERQTGEFIPESPTKSIHFEKVSKLNKVTHNHPMLSLDKTKDLEDIKRFCGDKDIIAMAKMDGLTCSLRYVNGELVGAETRGNGEIGEDIFHNIKFVKGVPLTIPIENETIVDGEVICTYKDFEDFKEIYKNPRNFASGSIRLLDSLESAKRRLTFVAWDCIKGLDDEKYLGEKLFRLKDIFHFITVPYYLYKYNVTEDSVEDVVNNLKEHVYHLGYPIDGIVFKYDDCEYYNSLGATGHHFRGGLAFKFYDETYSTRLKYIDWTMGRIGQLTPTAVFEPIDIDGTIVERASLHNVSVMHETLGPCAYYGEPLEVYKANQIIPQIASAGPFMNYGEVIAQGGASAHDVLEHCPICGGEVEIRKDGIAEIYYCTNPNCEGKFLNQLDHFCGKKGLDIKGLSKATLEKLIDWNWIQDYAGIYNALQSHKDEWVNKPGFGVASVKKIFDAIEASKNTELWRVISAAGIPFIGSTASKVIANYYKDWDSFRHAVFIGEDFTHLPDFGTIMNKNIHEYDFEAMDEVVKWLNISCGGADETVRQVLEGKQFCVTGKVTKWKNRDELKAYIESLGGKVTGSVTSKTHYLINNDVSSTTQKNETAKKLGIPILSEEDFLELIQSFS